MQKKIRPFFCLVIAFLVMSCGGGATSNNNSSTPVAKNESTENKKSPEPSPTATPDNSKPLRITSPVDNAQVEHRPFVEGTVADSTAPVWVIVRPMQGSDYSVQPVVTMREGGNWKVQIYIGEPGKHVGEHFEIVAVAAPTKTLKEGDKLKALPEAKWKSQIVEVIRK